MKHSLEILKRRVSEMAEKGEKLIGGILFDEMSIRKHIQWVNDNMYGFENIPGMDKSKADVASEALVFMFTSLNDSIRLPVAYFFVTKKMDALTKMDLLNEVISSVFQTGAVVKFITFDGFRINPAMCRLLGANLDVFSETFKPSFDFQGKTIHIFLDFSHAEKLVRNTLGSKEILFDAENNEIKWKYFERLVYFKDNRNFSMTHKLNQSHIEWKSNPMKVKLAVQIFSSSTARAMEFLMQQGCPEFVGAEATIKLTRMFDKLFDVCNSTDSTHENTFKNPLNPKNAAMIFELFEESTSYIKGMQIIENGKKIKVCSSLNKTGFIGFIVNMLSITKIYHELVLETGSMQSIRTHYMSQDHLEVNIK